MNAFPRQPKHTPVSTKPELSIGNSTLNTSYNNKGTVERGIPYGNY
jgi:hypothetical protein